MIEIKKNKPPLGLLTLLPVVGLLSYAVLTISAPQNADAAFAPESCYDFVAGYNMIVDYNPADDPSCEIADLDIPATIGGTAVQHIDAYAFSGITYQTSVTLPASLLTVGDYAFAGNELSSVSLNDGLTTLGQGTFNTAGITSIVIPDSVTTMGTGVFNSASNLSSVTIGSGIATIPSTTFINNSSLTSIDIPSTVTTIGSQAFDSTGLTSITLHEGLETIRDHAFYNNSIDGVALPDSVTTVESFAFLEAGLNWLTIGSGLDFIQDNAFLTNNLTNLVIPDTVTTIDYNAFWENNIATLDLGEGVETIGESAFDGQNITNLVIPESVTSVGYSSFTNNPIEHLEVYMTADIPSGLFYNIPTLESLIVGGGVGQIGSGAFGENPLLTSATIQEGPTVIGYASFQNANLSHITIPASVTEIRDQAFSTNSLQTVTILGNPTLTSDTILERNGLDKTTIPGGLTAAQTMQYYQDNGSLVVITAPNEAFASTYPSNFFIEDDGASTYYVTGGYITNAATVTLRYVDTEGAQLLAPVSMAGINGSILLTDYAILNTLDTTDPLNPTVDMTPYLRVGQDRTFSPAEITNYTLPGDQTVTLTPGESIVTFVYAAPGEEAPAGAGSGVSAPNTGVKPQNIVLAAASLVAGLAAALAGIVAFKKRSI